MRARSYSTLPDEIIIDIIFRLPTKSVGQCRCVCKSWRGLLSGRQFAKDHFSRTRYLLEQKLIFLPYNRSNFYYVPLKIAHQVFDEITFPPKKLSFPGCRSRWTQVCGSCDGLLLVKDKRGSIFVLNPTTREVRQVPPSPFIIRHCRCFTRYAFGRNAAGDEYKVVSLTYYAKDFKDDDDCTKTFLNVYSLETGVWKSVDTPFYWNCCTPESPGIFVNGSVHWVACRAPDYELVIMVFDLSEEKFFQIPPPTLFIGPASFVFYFLVVLDGHLCTFDIDGLDEIWVMKEYGIKESWTSFTIDSPSQRVLRPLCMYEEDLVTLDDESYDELVLFNLKEKTLKNILVRGMPNGCRPQTCFVETGEPYLPFCL